MSKTLTLEYPDTLPDSLHMSPSEFEREARLSMGVKLFETGRLSSGQAAQLAGISRLQFLYELGQFGMSAIQLTLEELEEEVASAPSAQ
jgi:predicted HTH domain antitoxin